MRNLNASENDLVFIKNRSFATGKFFYLMQRKPRVSGAAGRNSGARLLACPGGRDAVGRREAGRHVTLAVESALRRNTGDRETGAGQ
jgi:hypothetical protein